MRKPGAPLTHWRGRKFCRAAGWYILASKGKTSHKHFVCKRGFTGPVTARTCGGKWKRKFEGRLLSEHESFGDLELHFQCLLLQDFYKHRESLCDPLYLIHIRVRGACLQVDGKLAAWDRKRISPATSLQSSSQAHSLAEGN